MGVGHKVEGRSLQVEKTNEQAQGREAARPTPQIRTMGVHMEVPIERRA